MASFDRLSNNCIKLDTEIDNLKVSIIGQKEMDKSFLLLFKCQTDITNLLELNDLNEIIIPREVITRTDTVIESAINLISVFEHSKRIISSPLPPVAFIPDNDEERKWLDSTQGFNPLGVPIIGVRFKLDLSLQEYVQDRFDGIALIAEANAQDHPAGSFHELIRFFERAFTLSSTALVTPLGNFLEQSNQGFTLAEIQKWLVDIRHPATHADRKEYFVLERGIRPVVHRMTQAAYDVLLNKLEWRSSRVSRREIWKPEGGTAIPSGSKVFLTTKTPVNFQATIMDAFDSYPVNAHFGIENFLDKNLWFKQSRLQSKGNPITNGA